MLTSAATCVCEQHLSPCVFSCHRHMRSVLNSSPPCDMLRFFKARDSDSAVICRMHRSPTLIYNSQKTTTLVLYPPPPPPPPRSMPCCICPSSWAASLGIVLPAGRADRQQSSFSWACFEEVQISVSSVLLCAHSAYSPTTNSLNADSWSVSFRLTPM